MAEAGLSLRAVRIWQGARCLLEIDHHIAPGEVLTVMGRSGSGKSTLLSLITGTLSSDFWAEGEVILNGESLAGLRPDQRRVGILFQDDLLFPHLSVGENLAFGLQPGVRDRKARVAAALHEIGLDGYDDRDPATLSGGQKVRVALMRMLLSEPRALLLDEPFGRLDTELRAQIRTLVFRFARDRALPVLMVTHDREDAVAAGGTVFDISKPGGCAKAV